MEDRPHPFRNCPIEILRCPITHSSVRELAPDQLAEINRLIETQQVLHYDGSPVQAPLQRGLRSTDGRYAYRIDDGILAMLAPLAIARTTSAQPAADRQTLSEKFCDDKRSVQQFYDEVGWCQEDGNFEDARKWEDLRPVAADYISKCHMRVNEHLRRQGGFLLDVACGPVQYSEYLTYSEDYTARICVDISVAALRAAQRNVGPAGIFILGDITNLPLASETVQGVVCLHTIYHVPAAEQAHAFHEVHRVLAPGHNGVVVYSWRSSVMKVVLLPSSAVRRVGRIAGKVASLIFASPSKQKNTGQDRPALARLYFHAYPYSWFARQCWGFAWHVRPWRSVTVSVMKFYFHRWLMGRALFAMLFWFEQIFPRFLGKYGAYGMIVIHKHAKLPPVEDNAEQRGRIAA